MKSDSASRVFRWSVSPEACALSNEEVHVWIAALDNTSFENFRMILSSDEVERAARFRFERDRKHFIAARGLLRTILSRYTNTSAAGLQFDYGKTGKPYLANGSDFGNLNFNLSHSDGVALYAFARDRELGIDLENIRSLPEMDEIAARCFSPEEQASLRHIRSPQKEKLFFRSWTRTEAQLKCIGAGFSDGESPRRFDGLIHEFEPAENYVATLAIRGKSFTLKAWQFRESFVQSPRLRGALSS